MNISKVGEQIKEFNTHNQEGKEVRLSDYKGQKLIVFFYPKASTPGCTAEVCDLRDNCGNHRKKYAFGRQKLTKY